MGMADRGPADRELLRRHPNDPLKGIAFVHLDSSHRLTLMETDRHVATIDLEVWFSWLLATGEAEVCPGWKVKLERVEA